MFRCWQLNLRQRPILLSSVGLVWFQPQAADNCLVAMQLTNMVVLLTAVLALACALSPRLRSQMAAWICGLLAFFASANGLLVLFLVLGLALIVRSWRSVFLGSCLIPAALFLYFRDFVNPESQTMALKAQDLLGNFGVMLGGVLAFGPLPIVFPLALGWSLFGISVFAGIYWIRQRSFFAISVLLFAGVS